MRPEWVCIKCDAWLCVLWEVLLNPDGSFLRSNREGEEINTFGIVRKRKKKNKFLTSLRREHFYRISRAKCWICSILWVSGLKPAKKLNNFSPCWIFPYHLWVSGDPRLGMGVSSSSASAKIWQLFAAVDILLMENHGKWVSCGLDANSQCADFYLSSCFTIIIST